MAAEKALELYIHIPFCVRKCNYCDFLSMPAGADVYGSYVHRLLEEIRQQGIFCRNYQVLSVFIGGGTPSLLASVQVLQIMEAVQKGFRLKKDAEITLECNPGTLTGEKLSFYKSAGINRLSLGLQSVDDRHLQRLGRIHTYRDFLESFDLARKKEFNNINVDLMSALPGQTPADWAYTLKKVTELQPEHISAYSLIVEEGTPFYEWYGEDELRRERGGTPLMLPTEECEREMYEMTREILETRGYLRYEISNYALPGRECRHNIGYWTLTPYLGLGLGSSSFLEHVRFSNTKDLDMYLNGDFVNLSDILEGAFEPEGAQAVLEGESDIIYLDKRQRMEEFMFLGLRMTEGISRDRFEEMFGVTIESVYGHILQKLRHQGLLQLQENRVSLTEQGIAVSNYVFCEFLEA